MRIITPSWVSGLRGYNGRLVFFGYKDREGLSYARTYKYPELTSQNSTFGAEAKAVTDTTWNAADVSFMSDMQTYADAWNLTQQSGHQPMRDVSDLNLFVKACFAAAESASFDLSTLTVDNFGGAAGDLLGTEDPNVGNLITAAGMPSCGLDLSTLSNPITAA